MFRSWTREYVAGEHNPIFLVTDNAAQACAAKAQSTPSITFGAKSKAPDRCQFAARRAVIIYSSGVGPWLQ